MAQLVPNHISEMTTNFTDARTIKWPLLSSPMPIIFISLGYVYFVYFGGPQFMKNRKPYSLKKFIQCYNFFQIIANFLVVFNIITNVNAFAVMWRYCETFDEFCGRNSQKLLEVHWWTLLLKIIDLIETIIFVLRKKDNQISFLHTYHHFSTVLYVWATLRYFPHSYILTVSLLNSSVHMIMYSYYFLSTLGPDMQRRLLFIKKWITAIQIGHLAILTLGSVQGFVPNCGNMTIKYFSLLTFFDLFVNLIFFFNFYSSYKKSKTP